jgi:hypothetical protein
MSEFAVCWKRHLLNGSSTRFGPDHADEIGLDGNFTGSASTVPLTERLAAKDICSNQHCESQRTSTAKRAEPALAWQVLQEIRQVLEILGDQRISHEGEIKRFRAKGDFLLRALTDLISQCRGQIHQLGQDVAELEKLAGERELPRDVLQTIHHMARRQKGARP